MKAKFILIIFISVNLTVASEHNSQGCKVNGDIYNEDQVVLTKKDNCFQLKCVKETNGKKTKFRVKSFPFKDCECNTIPCPGPEICTLENKPVCGNDRSLYSNKCFLNVAACLKKNLKESRNPKSCQVCPNKCPKNYLPICGTDGVLYDNICELQSVACTTPGLKEARDPSSCEGVCPDFCTAEYNPVCASNGVTFSNPCEFQRYLCKVDSSVTLSLDPAVCDGLCPQCPNLADPVCGTDDVTYLNECYLKSVAKPCGKQDLSVSYIRPCFSDCYEAVCNNDYKPVCGSDGVLYANLCQFYQEICTNAALKEAEDPSTCSYTCPVCTPIYAPVCGTNDVTYDNECYLLSIARPCGTVDVQVASLGLCPDDCGSAICTEEFDPICGSDGVEYTNRCKLKVAICADPTLTQAQDPSVCSVGPGRYKRKIIAKTKAKRETGSDDDFGIENDEPDTPPAITVPPALETTLIEVEYLNASQAGEENMTDTSEQPFTGERSHTPSCSYNGKSYRQGQTIRTLDSYCAEIKCGRKKSQAVLKLAPLRVSQGQQCLCTTRKI